MPMPVTALNLGWKVVVTSFGSTLISGREIADGLAETSRGTTCGRLELRCLFCTLTLSSTLRG
ncbi:MAG: hypothetical protein BWY87_01685 [Deltaproteobacteria bacterium ADurb.Bin510]|nr:MAG: hypothetical protein BWY87_01685 [Deltaproteobacteria bacterium ADurb.Bin510]